jgi:trimeric autotransporter adhesin
MAYQPKSYRKFIATAATATLVAGAVAPVASLAADFTDVTAKYKEAVDFVVSKGINGTSSTTFGTDAQIKRVDAAVMVAAVLGLDTEKAPAGGFTDVPERAVGAVNALKAAGITSGKTATTFDADSNITRGELAIWIQKGFKLEGTSTLAFTDVTERYAAAVKALVDNKVTSGTSATTFGVNNFAKRGDFAIFLQKADLAAKAGVVTSTTTAVGVKKLEVKFNKAVDTTKAAITVKKGSSTIAVAKTTWSEDKKSVVLELNSNLTAGKYTVNVDGLQTATVTSEVTVETEKVTSVELLSDSLILTADGSAATVGYEVRNQYGEAISNKAVTPYATKGTTTATGGTVTVTAAGLEAGQKVTVTLIENETGKSASKELTVSNAAKTDVVTFVGVVDVNAKAVAELNQANHATAYFVEVTAKDQYGRAITSAATLNNDLMVTLASAGVATLIDQVADVVGQQATLGAQPFVELTDATGKKHLAIALDVNDVSGDAIITVVPKSTGKGVQHTVTVAKRVLSDVVSVGAADVSLIAGGDKVLFPVTAKNNKGEDITKVADLGNAKIEASIANSTAKYIEKDGKLFAEVVLGDVANEVSTLVLTATSDTGKVDTEIVSVRKTAAAKAVIGLKSTVANYIYAGQTVTLAGKDFVVQDQYGREMDTTGFTADKFTVAETANNNVVSTTGLAITAGGTKGTEALTFGLAGVTGSSTDVTFRVVDNSEFVNYEVADITKVYANAPVVAPAVDSYTKAVKVYGITGDGKKVLLPATQFTVVESSNYLTYANGVLDGVEVTTDEKTYEGTVEVIVTINATGHEFKKSVTVSEAAPTVETVEVHEADKAVTTLTYTLSDTEVEFDATDIAAKVVVVDSYGVKNTSFPISRLTISNIVNKEGAAVSVVNNGLANAKVSSLGTGDTFDATIVVGGKSVKLAVTVK